MSYIQEKEKIVQELLKSNKIKPGQSIDYKYFIELYEPYKNKLKEASFAEILGITYANYMNIKNQGTNAKVLKNNLKKLTEEKKDEVVQELLDSNKIKPGQSIDYTYFLELYKPYKDNLNEGAFVEILGITYVSYMNIKNRGKKAKVLKNKVKELSEEEKRGIIQELLESNKIKPEQSIDYKYFLKLYEPYRDKLKEASFAEILGITYANYMNIKNKGRNTKVLKNKVKELSEEEKEGIVQELLESKKIKPGQLIDYKYFIELYEPYKEKLNEVDFAGILEITYFSLNSMKYQGKKAKVLKDKVKELSEEKKEIIIQKLLESDKIKPGQSIDYKYFIELYEPYKNKLKEEVFAETLGITYASYMSIKNKGKKAKVLKNKVKELSEEEKEIIIQKLLESDKIKPGQSIDYKYFIELYEPYKNKLKEAAFAEILGISYINYMIIKHQGTKAKVEDFRNKQKLDRIKYRLRKEKRYYSKEEIKQIAKEYEININTIIQHIWCAGYENNVSNYITLLEEKGQIWMGELKCSKDFANKHARTIMEEAKKISKRLCSKYKCKHIKQDLASEAIEYILQQCGDIEKNFYDKEDISKKCITYRIIRTIKFGCLSNLRTKEKSFYGKFTYKGDKKERNVFDRGIEDKTQRRTQEIVEEKILRETIKNAALEETCIEILTRNVELGLSREEALSKTGEILEINPEEMLQILQNYMIKQKKVRITEDGGYVLGE